MATTDLLIFDFSIEATPNERPLLQVRDATDFVAVLPKVYHSGALVQPKARMFVNGEWVEIIKPAP